MIKRMREYLAAPDKIMLELGAGGELVVARIRLAIAFLLFLPPIINTLSGGPGNENLIGFLGGAFAVFLGCIWYMLARERGRFPWLPWASTTYDITGVTLFLFLLSLHDRAAGLNSFVIWEFYLTNLLLTCLRNDARLTLFAGGLAILQYLALAQWIFANSSAEQLASVSYGTALWSTVGQRTVVLLVATIVAVTTVTRMHRLSKMSGTDSLTGIPNRNWFLHQAKQLIDSAMRARKPVCIAIIDLDHFKRINDEVGHQAGDDALIHAVSVIHGNVTAPDTVGRLGGEEFGLLIHADLETARTRVDRIRVALEQSRFQTPGAEQIIQVTLSSGIAHCDADGQSLTSLMGVADRRLRKAKSAGRNCVHHVD